MGFKDSASLLLLFALVLTISARLPARLPALLPAFMPGLRPRVCSQHARNTRRIALRMIANGLCVPSNYTDGAILGWWPFESRLAQRWLDDTHDNQGGVRSWSRWRWLGRSGCLPFICLLQFHLLLCGTNERMQANVAVGIKGRKAFQATCTHT